METPRNVTYSRGLRAEDPPYLIRQLMHGRTRLRSAQSRAICVHPADCERPVTCACAKQSVADPLQEASTRDMDESNEKM